jgi:hypothetical protein
MNVGLTLPPATGRLGSAQHIKNEILFYLPPKFMACEEKIV